jgi:hypothetical protein
MMAQAGWSDVRPPHRRMSGRRGGVQRRRGDGAFARGAGPGGKVLWPSFLLALAETTHGQRGAGVGGAGAGSVDHAQPQEAMRLHIVREPRWSQHPVISSVPPQIPTQDIGGVVTLL